MRRRQRCPRPFRQPDGLWRGSRGWRNQQVTALLTFGHELRPWSVSIVAPSLWFNPHATHALSPRLPWRGLELDAEANRLVKKPGSFEPDKAFQLPDAASFYDPGDWPGKAFANRFDGRVADARTDQCQSADD
jgi:hypothetical protein